MLKILSLTLLATMVVSIISMPVMTSAEGGVGRIPSVTRLVRVFFQLEGELGEAVEKRDVSGISKLLSDDFEMRVGAMPGIPIPRATWIQRSFAAPKATPVMEQMAVHNFDNIAIVSFLWKLKAAKSKTVHDIFIVDTWRHEAGAWKLAIRYAGASGQGDYLIPGAPISEPAFEKKE